MEYGDIWEEIKHTVSLSEEMEKHGIYLIRKNNGRKMSCVCPFHPDNDPSMIINVDDEVETFHCFGCGVSGSVIDFVMKARNVGLIKTLEYFQKNYNLLHSSEMDVSKMIERTIKRKQPIPISSFMIRFSRKIRPFIRKSKDFKADLMKLKPMLQLADESAYLGNQEYLNKANDKILRTLKEIERFRKNKEDEQNNK